MLHLPVLRKEGNIVDGSLDAQGPLELIIQLDRDRSHLRLDVGAQPTLVEAIAQLSLVVAIQLAAKKGGNICRFDCIESGFPEGEGKTLATCSGS